MSTEIKTDLMEIKEVRRPWRICGLENFEVFETFIGDFEGHEIIDTKFKFELYLTPAKLVTYLRYLSGKLGNDQKIIISAWGETQAVVSRDLVIYMNGLRKYIERKEDEMEEWNFATLEERVQIMERDEKPEDCNAIEW